MRAMLRLQSLFLALVAALALCTLHAHAAPTAPSALTNWSPLSLAQQLQQSIFNALSTPSNTHEQDLGAEHSFTLRHAIVHPLDHAHPRSTCIANRTASALAISSPLSIRTSRQRILRPADPHAYVAARAECAGQIQCLEAHTVQWDEVDIDAPDVTHRDTLLTFAKMASTAYENSTEAWQPGFGGFNLSESFGWSENGMRGHVFTSNDNSTIILAIKGTSPPFFPGGTDTVRRDKENDNLLFSCCCARVSWTWSPVCDCYSGTVSNTSTASTCPAGLGPTGPSTLVDPFLPPPGDLDLNTNAASGPTQQCGQTCLERALVEKSVYYSAAMDLYNNVSYIYPDSQIWITGHSLGGSLSALLGMTFGVPTVTFEAPGERMAAQRLHLPLPPTGPDSDESPVAKLPITHVYHTADPIAMGDCQGTASICSSFGYAMESRCHTGKSIIYDTVAGLGWASSINLHRITFMADDILTMDWDKRVAAKGVVPKAKVQVLHNSSGSSREGWRVVAARRRRREEQERAEGVKGKKWRWPWQRGDGEKEEEDGGKEDPDGPGGDLKRAVPIARNEDSCRDCADWKFADKF
ncbi:unnamed protein product [Tilletia caries]|uniref:triacylglycerol lipase n=2 Tax=Tilletia caries TaxID=13290 RepID=A0ABN7IR97_9BASI|nr:unnamed protein product [Tilletia caries]CAD6912196.1 unnamed protein product [Tilletia caries]CAD6939577.1 unnamed protein product [Tilletia controversa]CAD6944734.1 unnamed protein product [Tilletia controversa]